MWYAKSKTELEKILNTSIVNGLNSDEVNERVKKYGLNKLAVKKGKSTIRLFFEQLNDALIYILIGAAVISGLLGEISDAIIIGAVVLINAVVGVIQESKAEQALEALKKMASPKAVVKRDGSLKEIPSEEVVPGDIIIIDAGRYVPCDLRIVESANLKLDESALTGESIPVEKAADIVFDEKNVALGDQVNMAFMSTTATYGRGIGIAVETGMSTEIGKIASLIENSPQELTPLQQKLDRFGKTLGISILILCGVMFIVEVLQKYFITGSVSKNALLEMFLTAVSLAVAAIPEGMPATVVIVLAIGMQKMIKRNAIIRKLPAVETLGSVNIICSDKTGTLTQNKMTVTKFYTDKNISDIADLNTKNKTQNLLLENLILCNDAAFSHEASTGDPTEVALIEAGIKHNIFKDELSKEHQRTDEIPFDSDRKLMTTVNKYDIGYLVMTKGAVDNLLKICSHILINNERVPLTNEFISSIQDANTTMSNSALRVLGAAYKKLDSTHIEMDKIEEDLTFIGMVGMIDPPRLEVKDSISKCKASGIETVMITGDHKNTALAIAKELNIAADASQAISGAELDELSQEDLNKLVPKLRVFSRVSPEHKVKIVKAFKANGNIVSMTGDGVNDAPSLKASDIGVAMGITGTDVAKGASDMILTDDNFSTIVSAIEEGRNIYNNIKKAILFLLSCNLGEIITMFFAIIIAWQPPLRPIHILWVNLITDSLPALSLGMDPDDKDIMKQKPRSPKESLFANGGFKTILINGLLIGGLTLFSFRLGLKMYNSLIHAQTMAFIVLSISQLFYSFSLRNSEKSIFKLGFFTNKYLIGSLLIGIFLQAVVVMFPPFAATFKVYSLSFRDWMLVLIISVIPFVFNETFKIIKGLRR